MSDLVFSRKEVDSIDMYVSNDGKMTALSVSGLAILCGIAQQSMAELLNRLHSHSAGKAIPKPLECLVGNVFIPTGYTVNAEGFAASARLVYSKAASRIIRYFAYKSKAANDVAKQSYDVFADSGLDGWIKKCTGYRDVIPHTSSTITMSIAAMEALHAIVGEQIRDAKIIKEEVPGVGTLLTAYRKIEESESALPNPFLLCEYLKTKQVGVNKSTKARFAQFLVGFYRGVSLAIPEKLKYRDGVYIGNSNCYELEKVPLLDAAWNNFCEIQK